MTHEEFLTRQTAVACEAVLKGLERAGLIDGCGVSRDYPFAEIAEKNARMVRFIEKVIFNGPATIVIWGDGTKTVVKCGKNDIYDPEKGLAMAIVKRLLGNKGNYNNVFRKHIG